MTSSLPKVGPAGFYATQERDELGAFSLLLSPTTRANNLYKIAIQWLGCDLNPNPLNTRQEPYATVQCPLSKKNH